MFFSNAFHSSLHEGSRSTRICDMLFVSAGLNTNLRWLPVRVRPSRPHILSPQQYWQNVHLGSRAVVAACTKPVAEHGKQTVVEGHERLEVYNIMIEVGVNQSSARLLHCLKNTVIRGRSLSHHRLCMHHTM